MDSGEAYQSSGAKSLLRELRVLWPMLLLSSFGGALLYPNLTYLGLDFFAREHTSLPPADIHCELTSEAHYCRAAVAKNTAWQSFLQSVSCVIKFILAPAIGSVSDAFGRRRVLLLLSTISLVPGIACVMYVYGGFFSLYWVFALSVLADLPLQAVFFSICIDMLAEHPERRASAFGLIAAMSELSTLLGLAVGSQLQLRSSIGIAILADGISLTFSFFLLPETLPTKLRRPMHYKALMPGAGMAILVRDRLFRSLSFCVVISTFVGGGVSVVAGSFLQASLPWSREDSLEFGMVMQVSCALWLGIGMHIVMDRFGELGALSIAFISNAVMSLMVPLVTKVWQVMLLAAVLGGPGALAFPAISALKSNLAEGNEQGELQGALFAAQQVAQGLAPLVFGGSFSFLLSRAGPVQVESRACARLVLTAGATCMLGPIIVASCALPALLQQRKTGRCDSTPLLLGH